MTCKHEKKSFKRFRYEVAGQTRYHKACQCNECGQRVKSPTGGIWWPADFGENVANLPDFDLEFLDKQIREEELGRRKQYKSDQLAKHEEYEKYLQSDEWKARRGLVIARCGGLCEACLSVPATQVHHTNYDSIYNEVLWCLKGVCRPCHEKIHGVM